MLTMAFFWTAVETRNNSTTNSCKQHFTEVGADFFLAQSVAQSVVIQHTVFETALDFVYYWG